MKAPLGPGNKAGLRFRGLILAGALGKKRSNLALSPARPYRAGSSSAQSRDVAAELIYSTLNGDVPKRVLKVSQLEGWKFAAPNHRKRSKK